MTRVAKGALWLLALIALIVVGFRVVRPREGTRSVSIRTSVSALKDQRVSARNAVGAARAKCTDLNRGLELLGVRGPSTVVVRESAPNGTSARYSVNCETYKASVLVD